MRLAGVVPAPPTMLEPRPGTCLRGRAQGLRWRHSAGPSVSATAWDMCGTGHRGGRPCSNSEARALGHSQGHALGRRAGRVPGVGEESRSSLWGVPEIDHEEAARPPSRMRASDRSRVS